MPKIGDQVLVGHLSNGSCAGVIIGPVWHGDYQPADGREGVYRKEYSNEPGTANETYDAGAKAYSQTIDGTAEVTATESWTIQVGGCTIQANKDGTMTIMASKKITINAPEVEFLEKVTVKKETTLKKTLLVEKQITPSKILTPAAFKNAIIVHSAIGGSTNGTIHLPSICLLYTSDAADE